MNAKKKTRQIIKKGTPFSINIEKNKTISDGGITVDFWITQVHTSN